MYATSKQRPLLRRLRPAPDASSRPLARKVHIRPTSERVRFVPFAPPAVAELKYSRYRLLTHLDRARRLTNNSSHVCPKSAQRFLNSPAADYHQLGTAIRGCFGHNRRYISVPDTNIKMRLQFPLYRRQTLVCSIKQESLERGVFYVSIFKFRRGNRVYKLNGSSISTGHLTRSTNNHRRIRRKIDGADDRVDLLEGPGNQRLGMCGRPNGTVTS